MEKLRFAVIILFPIFALETVIRRFMIKRVLRYLIPFVVVLLSFIGNSSTTEAISTNSAESIYTSDIRTDCTIECTEVEPSLSIPRQASASSSTHLHGTAKRCNNAHKHNFEFTKSGKCFSTCIGGYIHQHQLLIRLSFTKSHHRLIGLGKLII